jgi:mannose-6-phosphate isomerase-like protein (cupin superfamily)
MREVVNLAARAALLTDAWSPRIVAQLNDYHLKVARLEGAFVWHSHPETDEAFLVLDGALRIELRDGALALAPGDLAVIPRGVEHRPVADGVCHVLLIEPAGTVNTGDAGGARTVDPAWI